MKAGTYELIIDCTDLNDRKLSFTEFENDYGTYNVKILIPYVFKDYSINESNINQNVEKLTNTIDLTAFVDSTSIHPDDDLSYYRIEITFDESDLIGTCVDDIDTKNICNRYVFNSIKKRCFILLSDFEKI